MKRLKMPLLTSKYTKVFVEEQYKYNAPHRFKVCKVRPGNDENDGSEVLADIHFQEGPIKECGINGVNNEDLINMVVCRLEHFQDSPYKCKENDMAITKLEEALFWLRKRTMERDARGVEGTSAV